MVSLNGVVLYLQIINKRCRVIQSYSYPSQQHLRAERGAKEVGASHYGVTVVGPEHTPLALHYDSALQNEYMTPTTPTTPI